MGPDFGARAETAEGRAAEHRTEVPRTATLDDLVADVGPGRIIRGAVLVIVRIVEVLTPLPRVPVHVVKAPIVRLLGSHPRRSVCIIGEPGVALQLGLVVSVAIPSPRCPGPATILPLGLCGQAVFL